MTLESIVNEVIPIPANCCRLIREHKEWQRKIMIERIEQGKDLHLIPEKVLKRCKKFLPN
jgi:hypothetical protein